MGPLHRCVPRADTVRPQPCCGQEMAALRKMLLLLLCAAGAAHAETNAVFIDDFETTGACPPGRIRSTVMAWRYDGVGRTATDVTRAENIWGRSQAGMPTVPLPWLNYFAIFWSLPRNGYVAAEFTVPTDLQDASGMFTHGETLPGPETDMAISTRCGDFNPPEAFCLRADTRTGQRMGTWRIGAAGPIAACELTAGRTYYINIRFSDPAAQSFYCNGSTCQTTVQHNRSLN